LFQGLLSFGVLGEGLAYGLIHEVGVRFGI